jgi:hypothetical protein
MAIVLLRIAHSLCCERRHAPGQGTISGRIGSENTASADFRHGKPALFQVSHDGRLIRARYCPLV